MKIPRLAAFLLVLVACTTKKTPPQPSELSSQTTAPAPVAVDGRDVAEKACLSCHTMQMLQQQRLTEPQWTKVVAKMSGWGANLEASDTPALIAYLAANFGPDAGVYTAMTAPADELAPADDGVFSGGDAERGQRLYIDKCGGCHGTDARGHIGINLVDKPFLYRADELAKIVRRGRGKMPPQTVPDPVLADILAHLRRLR